MTKYEKLEKEIDYLKQKLKTLEESGEGNKEIVNPKYFSKCLREINENGSYRKETLMNAMRLLMRSLFVEYSVFKDCNGRVISQRTYRISKVEQMTPEQAELGKEFIEKVVTLYNEYLEKADILCK